MTMRTTSLYLCAAALAALAPRAAQGSAADAFENKVKPVSGQLYTKAGKIELTPNGALSLNDSFFSKYMGGLKLGYHLNEYFYLGVNGLYGTSSTTGSTTVCPNGQCGPATQDQLNKVPGEIKWIAGAELAFSPIYGKLNLFAEKAVHFDLSLLGGLDYVSYRDVVAVGAPAGTVPGDASTVGGHIGIGARVFLARFMALRLETKALLYSVSGLDRGNFQTQLFAEAGLSFFVPVAHRDAQ